MKVIVTKQFNKDVEKELDKSMKLRLADVLEQVQKAQSIYEIPNLKKLKGFKNAYRIRILEYRLGFLLEANIIVLSRVMNRKEIYRYFP